MGLQCWSYVATNKGPIFTSNIGPVLSSCELSVIEPIFLAICSQYWVAYFCQHLANIAADKGPIFTSNIGPILSSCELSVIGPIFLAIFSQYCVQYLSIIGPILLATWVNLFVSTNVGLRVLTSTWGVECINLRGA